MFFSQRAVSFCNTAKFMVMQIKLVIVVFVDDIVVVVVGGGGGGGEGGGGGDVTVASVVVVVVAVVVVIAIPMKVSRSVEIALNMIRLRTIMTPTLFPLNTLP